MGTAASAVRGAQRRPARVERALLPAAFDFDLDFDSVPITAFRILPDREGHDVQSCRNLGQEKNPASAAALFLPRGDIFVTGANRYQVAEGDVRVWRLRSGERVGEIVTDLNSIFGLAISPDGRFLAAGGGGAVFGLRWEYTGGVEVWNLEGKQRVARLGEEEGSVAFSHPARMQWN